MKLKVTVAALLVAAVGLSFMQAGFLEKPTSKVDAYQRATSSKQFELSYDKAKIRVVLNGSDWKVSEKQIRSWVKDAVESIISYYGRYPLNKTLILVNQTNDSGVGFATATYDDYREQGRIKVNLGRYTRPSDLKDTWTLTHEMVHLTFPLVHDKYNWLTEGIATYVEPIGRFRKGLITREKLWLELYENLPEGQPQVGDRGLNRTHTWGRTYWGGAIYCIVADIQLRKTTNNQIGLEDALKAIMNSGTTAESNLLYAPSILKIADRGTNTTVMTDLYKEMKDKPVRVDLMKIWKELGVTVHGKTIEFNDHAPLAHIRKSIETGKN